MRYYFVVIDYNSKTTTGTLNFGYSCNIFNKEEVMDAATKAFTGTERNNMVISNFIEFKNQEDYDNFFAKPTKK